MSVGIADDHVDVLVIGGGNAGFSAAHAAAERGREVLLLERGSPREAGGNSYFTAGAFRIAHEGWTTSGTSSTTSPSWPERCCRPTAEPLSSRTCNG
ncbi:FAD-dependent oxidoreductase [Blastococcus brunescens]|uniref:FAD-dependent oxidoreductase n=1 Tax=Blastococcus brunescens TaxID=1564165 RepID=A0ABZ1AYT0_9ACTN|nr:FAD-dependent oxidoreductase [Blastococcus sp. BMG 8361]WRL63629.1 FAD-dependent oxidoreductase [Blastococcus sp. BMG 8361]